MAVLLKAWIVLVLLTLASMGAGAAPSRFLPFLIQAALILAVAGFKASTILRHFLDLRSASIGWRLLFSIYLVVIGGTIFAVYAIGCIRAAGECALSVDGSMR